MTSNQPSDTAWFSDTIQGNPQLVQLSPDGQYVATSVQARLIVRATESMDIVASFTCSEEIGAIEWAADSLHILAASFKRTVVHAFRLHSTWSAKIDDDITGISACQWSPDASAILCTSNHAVKAMLAFRSVGCCKSLAYVHSPRRKHKTPLLE